MSTMNTIWDNAHEIPEGAYIPEGTELVQYDKPDDSLTVYKAFTEGPWMGSPPHAPVRSTAPISDPDDTGSITVQDSSTDGFVCLYAKTGRTFVYLTTPQALNLTRKITEALGV